MSGGARRGLVKRSKPKSALWRSAKLSLRHINGTHQKDDAHGKVCTYPKMNVRFLGAGAARAEANVLSARRGWWLVDYVNLSVCLLLAQGRYVRRCWLDCIWPGK